MIGFVILAVILTVLAAILFLPIDVYIKFEQDFFLKIKFLGVKVFEIEPEDEKQKNQTADAISDKKAENEVTNVAKSFFYKLKKKYGFSGAVKTLFGFAADVLTHIKRFLRHIKIKRVALNVTVASNNAAATAIEYGTVCAAAYPVLAFLGYFAAVRYKSININSDFNSKNQSFDFSSCVRLRIFFLIIALFGVYSEYKKFIEREDIK